MLLDFLSAETDEKEKQKIIEMLTMASDNLLETLENLNEVVSISTNVSEKKKPVKLNEKIASVSQSLATFLKKNNAKIINQVTDDIQVTVVPAYLESILMNFITNAVKYKHPDRSPQITLETRKADNYTILSITDNGLGIDLEKHGDKLFGMYKTFHDNSEAKGIGLYITKNHIEAMEGKITTNSEVGKGTTFNIYFNEKN
jgi:signal transduction histidine kinase